MSLRSKFKPKNEPSECAKCGSKLKIMYYDNCVQYECSDIRECDWYLILWKEDEQKKIVRGPSKPKPKTKEHLLTEEQVEIALSVCETPLEKFVMTCLTYSGLRAAEFTHMRKSWVDFDNGFITIPPRQECSCNACKKVRRALSKKTKALNERQQLKMDGYWTPKSKDSARTIPFPPHIKEFKQALKKFFKDHDEVLEVYPVPSYVNLTLNRIERRIEKKLGEEKAFRVFPHALRGTYATILAKMKLTPFEIKDALGWSDVAVASSYIKMSGEALKESYKEKWKNNNKR